MSRKDVLSAWRGWRPLARDPHAAPGAPAARDHVISRDPHTNVVFAAGGKWTTWREMAEELTITGTRQLFYARLPEVKGTAGGVSFVFDEVMVGFRVHPGGAQALSKPGRAGCDAGLLASLPHTLLAASCAVSTGAPMVTPSA